MDNIPDLSDKRLKLHCVHCGGDGDDVGGGKATRDHVPSKALLQKPYPKNLPTVFVCAGCNASFSADEEYCSLFLQCLLVDSTDPNQHTNPRVARALQCHKKLRNSIESSRMEVKSPSGETWAGWAPDINRIKRVIIKNGRGHALFEYSESMYDEPEHAGCIPLVSMTKEDRMHFENGNGGMMLAAYPEVGSRMMTRMFTGQDMKNGWIIVQDGVYRYNVEYNDGILVRSVLYEYLATKVYWKGC